MSHDGARARFDLAPEALADPQCVLERIARCVESEMGADGGASIAVWSERDRVFSAGASTVDGQESASVHRTLRNPGGSSRWVVDHGRPWVVGDTEDDPIGASILLTEASNRSYAGVPILKGEDCLGVIFAMHRDPRAFSSSEIDRLGSLADSAVMVLGDEAADSVPAEDKAPALLAALVVEDDPVLRRVVTKLLDREADVAAIAARSAWDARALLADFGRPDAAILDIKLEDGSGYDIAGLIRTFPDGLDTCIWMITGDPSLIDQNRHASLGIKGVLHKPFGRDAIGRLLDEVRSRPSSGT